jgi:hypothetical protein
MERPKRPYSISLKLVSGGRGPLPASSAGEEQVVEAVDELVLRKLVDVLLEGEVHQAPAVRDERALLDHADLLARHARPQPALDLGVLEVEEVSRVVPYEPRPPDRLAVTPDLTVGLQHQALGIGRERSRGQAADPRADDEVSDRLHRRTLAQPRRVRAGRCAAPPSRKFIVGAAATVSCETAFR